MKRLLLLRHAKSSWADASLSDFERPLNERGRRAAPLMGEFMRGRALRPDLIVSSPAARARETVELVTAAAGLGAELKFDGRIYEAGVSRLLEVIREVGDDHKELLLVGHNPGFEELLEYLTGESRRMSTAALACMSLGEGAWKDAARGSARLEWLVKPKELQEG